MKCWLDRRGRPGMIGISKSLDGVLVVNNLL